MNPSKYNAQEFARMVEKIAGNFFEENRAQVMSGKCGVVGVHTRGVFLARRIANILKRLSKKTLPVGSLDITLYRDDVSEIGNQPLVKETDIPFSIVGRTILLVDDVRYTGRTTRAAMDALLELGRPKQIKLAVMVDRDGRELPLHADYTGVKMHAGVSSDVQVRMKEIDGGDSVRVARK